MERYKKYVEPTEDVVRQCLMCDDEFLSQGTHNRVCKKCKSTQAWREGSPSPEYTT